MRRRRRVSSEAPSRPVCLGSFLICVVAEYSLTEDPLRQLGRNVPYLLGDHIPYQDAAAQNQKKAEAGGKNQTLSDIAPQPLRTFNVNDGETNDKLFVGNQIVTSKYTVVNFLPKNLVDQFSKLANIYFLGMMILQVSTPYLHRFVKFGSINFPVL